MEIEVKAKVLDMPNLKGKLEALGCVFTEPVTQDDAVFARKTGSLETFLSNDVFLRIRVQNNGRIILTAKRPINKSAETLVKDEHEVVVDSADEAKRILELAGFVEALRLKKTRQTAHYKEYEICLDEVEGLGTFIELEKMAEESAAAEIQRSMFLFLESLGVSPGDQVKKGYDILLLEKASAQ